MGKKVWNVVLVPEGGGAVRSLRLHARLVYTVAGIALSGVIVTLGSLSFHFWTLRGVQATHALRQENASLRSHLAQVNGTLEQVEDLVRDGARMERQARMLAGLDPTGGMDLAVGGPLFGGPPEASGTPGAASGLTGSDDPRDAITDPTLEGTVIDQDKRLEALSRQASIQKQSLSEALDRLKELGDKLAHSPSICPLSDPFMVTAGFGWRTDPFTGLRAFHTGLDLRAEPGVPVRATADGTVDFVGYDGEFGNCVRIAHGFGYETSYCHLSSTSAVQGQKVSRGNIIGKVGSTGRSTGPHLHYEVSRNGTAQDPSDHILTPIKMAD